MSLSAVNNVGMPPTGAPAPPPGLHPAQSVTSLLGMSADEIAKQMRSGKSLDDIARSKNVSHADLVAAIKASGPRELKLGSRPDRAADRVTRPQDVSTPGAQLDDGVGGQARPRNRDVDKSDKSDKIGAASGPRTPGSRTRLGAPSVKDPRDLPGARPLDGTTLSDLVKSAQIDRSALDGEAPKGLIVDTTA